jgi:hypothetical protein
MAAVTPVVDADIGEWQRTTAASFVELQGGLLACTVHRPPTGTGILEPSDAALVVQHMLQGYYRHFKLYKRVMAATPALQLRQSVVGGVELPPPFAPLSAAVQLSGGSGGWLERQLVTVILAMPRSLEV